MLRENPFRVLFWFVAASPEGPPSKSPPSGGEDRSPNFSKIGSVKGRSWAEGKVSLVTVMVLL